MLYLMVLYPFSRHCLFKLSLLIDEVVSVLDNSFMKVLLIVFAFNLEDGVEETPVLIINSGILCKMYSEIILHENVILNV